MVAWLGTRWYGRRVGLLSGFIQLTPFYVLMQARLAEADMLLCLWVTMAMVLFCGRPSRACLPTAPAAAYGVGLLHRSGSYLHDQVLYWARIRLGGLRTLHPDE